MSVISEMSNKAIIVLGMHRSGTSAIGGVLMRLGVDFGDSLAPAMIGVNDKGFYEHQGIVEISEKILEVLGYSWMDVRPMPDKWWILPAILPLKQTLKEIILHDFSHVNLWGVKDPRICRMLPLWLEVLSDLKCEPLFVLSLRHPDEVVESLFRRDGLESEGAHCLWLWHVLESEHYSRSYRRSFVFFSSLVENWKEVTDEIACNLDICWLSEEEQAGKEISDFVESGLRHCKVHKKTASAGFAHLSHKLFHILEEGRYEACEEIRILFLEEIDKNRMILESINRIQLFHESNIHLDYALKVEKANAKEQIEYRDALVVEVRKQLKAEKANAKEQIEYREALVAEVREQLKAEKANAKEQIEYRDALVAEVRKQLKAEKANAKEQIEYRDALVAEVKDKLEAKTLFYMFKKSSE